MWKFHLSYTKNRYFIGSNLFCFSPVETFSIVLRCCSNNSDLMCSSLSLEQDQSLVLIAFKEAFTVKPTVIVSGNLQAHDILPLSVYHFGLPMNSLTSPTILSATLSSSTTELRGLRLRGKPKGRHSAPMAVYMTVRPSSCFRASSLAERHN